MTEKKTVTATKNLFLPVATSCFASCACCVCLYNGLSLMMDCHLLVQQGGDVTDRKSTTGYIVKVAGNTVSWATKKQHTVALSTAEAEYMALSSGLQEQLSID